MFSTPYGRMLDEGYGWFISRQVIKTGPDVSILTCGSGQAVKWLPLLFLASVARMIKTTTL
jgi:hypothetical protein